MSRMSCSAAPRRRRWSKRKKRLLWAKINFSRLESRRAVPWPRPPELSKRCVARASHSTRGPNKDPVLPASRGSYKRLGGAGAALGAARRGTRAVIHTSPTSPWRWRCDGGGRKRRLSSFRADHSQGCSPLGCPRRHHFHSGTPSRSPSSSPSSRPRFNASAAAGRAGRRGLRTPAA